MNNNNKNSTHTFCVLLCPYWRGRRDANLSVFVSVCCLNREHEFELVKKTVSRDLEICGFIDVKDIANPPHIYRHLVLPLPLTSSPVKTEGHGAGN